MMIEHKIKKPKNYKDIYQVGNVIENNGVYFLIGTLRSKFIVWISNKMMYTILMILWKNW